MLPLLLMALMLKKYFNKEATLTQHTGYASYRIDQVNFDTVGAKKNRSER